MLPSFRLIAATFLCGFFVVFAGLRLAASLNDIHEGLPVLAAHAAPVSITPAADREARRGLAAVPMMYDLRFAVGTVAPIVVPVPPMVLDSPAPPLSIVPSDDMEKERSRPAAPEFEPANEAVKEAEPEAMVAAIPPAPVTDSVVVTGAPAVPEAPAVAVIDQGARPDPTAEQPAAAILASEALTTAIEPQITPAPATSAPATLAPATSAPATLAPPALASEALATANEPQAPPAIEQSLPNLEPAAALADPPAVPEPQPHSPAVALPLSKLQTLKAQTLKAQAAKSQASALKPQAAKPQAAKPQAVKSQAAKSSPRARIKVARKKPIRVARRAAPASAPVNGFGGSMSTFDFMPSTEQR